MNAPTSQPPAAQRCDLVLGADGVLQVVLEGDWIRPADVQELLCVLGDASRHPGPTRIDTRRVGELSQLAERAVQRIEPA